MADFSTEQLTGILEKAPPEVPHGDVMRELIKQGHTFNGKQLDPNNLQPIQAPREQGLVPQNPLEVASKGYGLAAEGFKGMQSPVFGGGQEPIGAGEHLAWAGQKTAELAQGATDFKQSDNEMMMVIDALTMGGGKGWNKFLAKSPEVQQVLGKGFADAKAIGMKLLPSQEFRSDKLASLENILKSLPGGQWVFNKFRAAEVEKFTAAKQKLVSQFDAPKAPEVLGTSTGTQLKYIHDQTESRAKSIMDRANAEAQELLDTGKIDHQTYLQQAKQNADNFQAIMEEKQHNAAVLARDAASDKIRFSGGYGPGRSNLGRSAKEKLAYQRQEDRIEIKRLYGDAAKELPEAVNSSEGVALRTQAQQEVDRLSRLGTKDGKLFSTSEKLAKGVTDQDVQARIKAHTDMGISPEQLQQMNPELAGQAKNNAYKYNDLHSLQSDLGEMAESHRLPNGDYGPEGAAYLRLRTAVQADRDALFEAAGGKAKEKYDKASAFFRDYADNRDSPAIRAAWKKNPEDIMDSIVKAGDVTDTRKLVKALGPDGKEVVQRHIFDDIFGASGSHLPSHEDIAKGLSDYAETMREVFSPQQIKEMRDFAHGLGIPPSVQKQYDARVRQILQSEAAVAPAREAQAAGIRAAGKQQAEMVMDPVLGTLVKKNPEQLTKAILEGNIGVARAISRYAPAQKPQYAARLMHDIVEGGDIAGKVAKFEAENPGFLGEFFPKKAIEDLTQLGSAQNVLKGYGVNPKLTRVEKAAAGGMAAAMGIGGFMIHPGVASAVSAGAVLTVLPNTMSKLLLSDWGRKSINTLMNLPPASPGAIKLTRQLMQLGYLTARKSEQAAP